MMPKEPFISKLRRFFLVFCVIVVLPGAGYSIVEYLDNFHILLSVGEFRWQAERTLEQIAQLGIASAPLAVVSALVFTSGKRRESLLEHLFFNLIFSGAFLSIELLFMPLFHLFNLFIYRFIFCQIVALFAGALVAFFTSPKVRRSGEIGEEG